MPLIMPIKELRNTTKISNIAHKEQKQLTQKQFLQNWRKNILDKYKVKVNPSAVRELDQIYEYIANEKLAPENAREQVDRIKKAVLSLDTFPH